MHVLGVAGELVAAGGVLGAQEHGSGVADGSGGDGDGLDQKAVDSQLDARTVGVSLDRLRGAKRAIFVTAGPAKHDIARTVVTSGLCGVLVTDETTARALLEEQ